MALTFFWVTLLRYLTVSLTRRSFQSFNGKPSILIRVFRVGDQSALEVASSIKSYVEKTAPTLPDGVEIGTFSDESVLLKGRIDLLTKNAYLGLTLVVLVLAIFLKPKLAFGSLWEFRYHLWEGFF